MFGLCFSNLLGASMSIFSKLEILIQHQISPFTRTSLLPVTIGTESCFCHPPSISEGRVFRVELDHQTFIEVSEVLMYNMYISLAVSLSQLYK